ncbi:MAG: hypothetical protein WC841_02395 [Candidatus Shapirobacteria bacterium]|jgi:hypothetical protein
MLLYLLLIFFFFSPPKSYSQEATPAAGLFDTYKTDYLYQRKIYQENYLDYSKKKEIHTQYGTLITQADKNEATTKTLIARNTMLKAYLMAIRVNMDQYEDQDPIETEIIQIELAKLEEWLDEQNSIVSSINNESDISDWAETFRFKYITIQQQIYSSLVQNEVNQKTLVLRKIQKLASDIQNSPQVSPESQQWFSSLPIKSDLVVASLDNAVNKMKKKQYSGNTFNNFYPEAKADLNKANFYLLEIIGDLKSIVLKFTN